MGTDSKKQFSETGADSVSGALALLHELPPLPATISQLIAALSDDEIDRHRLAATLEQCPSLAAKLVGLASSAYFRRVSQINSVSDAIFVIGSIANHANRTTTCVERQPIQFAIGRVSLANEGLFQLGLWCCLLH